MATQPAAASDPVTAAVEPSTSFSVAIAGFGSLSGGRGAVSGSGRVTLASTPSGSARMLRDGIAALGTGLDVRFSGTRPTAPLSLTLVPPARPAATGSSTTAAGALIPVLVHRSDDGTFDLLRASVDSQGRFVITTKDFSPHWPAWLDPAALASGLLHRLANEISGRSDPPKCAGGGPDWAKLTSATTLVHTCLITNKDSKGVPRAEAQLVSNRGFWLKTSVPGGADYVYTDGSAELVSKYLSQHVPAGDFTRLLPPHGLLTSGWYRPTSTLELPMTSYQDAYTVFLSLAASLAAQVGNIKDERSGWAAAWGVVACADKIPSRLHDAHGWWAALRCFLTDALPQLQNPTVARSAAISLAGANAISADVDATLQQTAKALKYVGKAFALIEVAKIGKDVWQQIPDAFSTLGNDTTGQVTLRLSASAAAPTLGTVWAPSQQGYGHIRPPTVFNGGDPTGLVENVTWTGWGRPTAVGHGTGFYAAGTVADGHQAPATVLASHLGTCHGRPSYNHITWYFPTEGETANQWGINICTGEYDR